MCHHSFILQMVNPDKFTNELDFWIFFVNIFVHKLTGLILNARSRDRDFKSSVDSNAHILRNNDVIWLR